MANKRTVDPTAEQASSVIVGIRMTETQVKQLHEMAGAQEVSRSRFVRQLIADAYRSHLQPEPF